jgi:protein O-GlcNAc transferase
MLGSSQPSRVAASIVSAIGKPEWAAPSINEYEDLAVSFANDKQQLRKVRANLRNAVRTSRAGSPEQYAHAVETAYRRVWRKWCNKQSC